MREMELNSHSGLRTYMVESICGPMEWVHANQRYSKNPCPGIQSDSGTRSKPTELILPRVKHH